MAKIIVGRRMVYLEVFEIGTDKLLSVRDDLDLCKRILFNADPVFSQQVKSFTEKGKQAVKFLSRTQDSIIENPIFPVTNYSKGLNEAVELKL